jgi:ATP phosphoribosyltransferase regulatory subunit
MDAFLPELALLPAGLHDLLPPDAEREAVLVEHAMGVFRAYGYERVKPPLVEFEESLLTGVGKSWALQTFRMMDPESQRMMGVRADMTLQVARLAATRLAKAPRPLRLCYSGEVLRVGGEQLAPERQLRQIGCELIGSLEAAADAEIILLAYSALTELGVTGLSIDLNLPTLVPLIFAAYGVTGADERSLAAALAHRDTAIVSAVPKVGALLTQLLNVAGSAESAIEKLAKIELPAEAEPTRARLTDTVRLVRQAAPGLKLTVDPLERQGFEYQTGLSFTLFARGARRELGRGGRYRVGGEAGGELRGEPAVGFSLFADAILKAAPVKPAAPRIYLPFGTEAEIAQALRAKDMITVSGLAPVTDVQQEAKRLGCQYVLTAGSPEPVAVG